MNKKITLSVLIISFYIFSVYSVYNLLNKQNLKSSEDLVLCNKELLKKQSPDISLNDIFLYSQKTKEISSSDQGKMFFSYTKNLLENGTWQLIIMLEGNPLAIADAADLELGLASGTEVIELSTKDAFPLYPRKYFDGKSVKITGVSAINKNIITYGKPDKVFAVIVIKTEKDNILPVTLNKEGTKIFFSAVNILDLEKNFTAVNLHE
jgi:hypothetical protein